MIVNKELGGRFDILIQLITIMFNSLSSFYRRYFYPNRKYVIPIYIVSFTIRIIYFLNHVSFSQDQVRDVLFIKNLIAENNFFIPFGPSASVGDFYLPPLYYYFQLVAHVLFSNSFYSIDFLIIIFESVTPIIIFFITFKITKTKLIALGASLIYIFSFGVVASSAAGNPNLVPLFSAIFIASFLYYFIEKRPIAIVSALVSMSVLINLHFQWFVLLPFALILAGHSIWFWKKNWRYLFIAGLLSLVIFSPYLIQEIQTGFENSKTALELLNNQNLIYERVRKPVYVTFFFANFYQRILFGNIFTPSWEHQYETFKISMIIGSILWSTILLICIRMAWIAYKKKIYYLPLYMLMFFLMAMFLRLYKGDKLDHYLFIFFTFFPVFIAVAFQWITQKRNIFIKGMPYVLLLIVQIVSLFQVPSYNDFNSFKKITAVIIEKAQTDTLLVEPTHQQLRQPLAYFLSEKYFDTSQKESVTYYVLFCYSGQYCEKYKPNMYSKDNIFKLNYIDPTDFSYFWDNPPTKSFVMSEPGYTAYFLKANEAVNVE